MPIHDTKTGIYFPTKGHLKPLYLLLKRRGTLMAHLKPPQHCNQCSRQQEHAARGDHFLIGSDWPCTMRPSDVSELNISSSNAPLNSHMDIA